MDPVSSLDARKSLRREKVRYVNVLGVRIAAIGYSDTIAELERLLEDGRTHYVCLSNVHTVTTSQFDIELKTAVNEADLALPDGMPLVWLANLDGHGLDGRVYGPELLDRFCTATAKRGVRHFFYGGTESVLRTLAARISELHPGINIVGTHAPPFRPLSVDEEDQLAELINDRVDVLWVGLGCPKQEKWMHAHRNLRVGVMIGVGAAFDFHAGRIPQAPLWMQRRGLEWLFRLVQEPRRLWRRYLILNPLFVVLTLLQRLGLKRYDATVSNPH
jgi:N-acetylglucosaminyldiphosphoundecaprenol N-acetyl-beta-D-mannosaminyltransferase